MCVSVCVNVCVIVCVIMFLCDLDTYKNLTLYYYRPIKMGLSTYKSYIYVCERVYTLSLYACICGCVVAV